MRVPPGLRRALALGCAALLIVALLGATYQGIANALDRRALPHPGRLVDAGGHQLHIYCTGQGTPTVVLESPAGGLSATWGWVQPAVAGTVRVCSYDRAGLGWSETGDAPYDPARVPDDLRALLTGAHERPPFILVGHGLGAASARLFASRYPNDVAALVLIDSPLDAPARPDGSLATLGPLSPWLARVGFLRLSAVVSRHADGLPDGWPSRATRAFLNRPDHLTRTAREIAAWDRAVRLAAAPPPGDTPVLELEVMGRNQIAFLNDRGRAEPVIEAILTSIAKVRAGRGH
jgi:pimeloyl-ACP methyl ester carboxylesterase